MNKKISIILKVFISLGLLFVLFKLVPYQELIETYKHSKKIYIFLGFIVCFLTFIISTVRWKFLLSSLGIKATLQDAFSSSFTGLFFNLIFPSFVAGDIFRGVAISNRHGEAKKVASSVLMDRFSGCFALALVAFFSFFAGRNFFNQKSVLYTLVILCALIALASFFIFSKTFFSFFINFLPKKSAFRQKINNFHDQLYFFRKKPLIFLKSLLFSIPIQILSPVSFFVISKAFGLHIEIIYFLILIPIVMMIAFIPITIAGAGLREGATVYFFTLVGIEKSVSLSMSLLNLVFTIILGLAGGFFYVTVYHRRLQSYP
jgi:uncharacterized protein (TIRG00374 family)